MGEQMATLEVLFSNWMDSEISTDVRQDLTQITGEIIGDYWRLLEITGVHKKWLIKGKGLEMSAHSFTCTILPETCNLELRPSVVYAVVPDVHLWFISCSLATI